MIIHALDHATAAIGSDHIGDAAKELHGASIQVRWRHELHAHVGVEEMLRCATPWRRVWVHNLDMEPDKR